MDEPSIQPESETLPQQMTDEQLRAVLQEKWDRIAIANPLWNIWEIEAEYERVRD